MLRSSNTNKSMSHLVMDDTSIAEKAISLDLLPQDDSTLTTSISSFASTNQLESTENSSSSKILLVQKRKGCLKFTSQIASLQHVFANHSKQAVDVDELHQVTFGIVEVHSHEIILGDNPAVSLGPPVTVDWQAFDSLLLTVDKFENTKIAAPRKGPEMQIPKQMREDMISRSGASSRAELAQTLRQVNSIKKSRSLTANRYAMNDKWRRRLSLFAFGNTHSK